MPILQINFKPNASPAEYRKICESVVQTIADVSGLEWKGSSVFRNIGG
jgi:hypothetical protein